MKLGFSAMLLFASGLVSGSPVVSLVDPATVQVSWKSEVGVQYRVSASEDLEAWSPLTGRLDGSGGMLVVEDEVGERRQHYYRVEEFSDYVLDLDRFKLGGVGNKWTYMVIEEGFLGEESYLWDSEIMGTRIFEGQEVLEWRFLRDGAWDQTIYILANFSNGIYEVGGEDPVEGEQLNDPPLPSLLGRFRPGAEIPYSHTSSALGLVESVITLSLERDPVVVGAGVFEGTIRVENQFSATVSGFPVDGTTVEWFALDVGLVKHIGTLEVFGSTSSTIFTLQSYDVD